MGSIQKILDEPLDRIFELVFSYAVNQIPLSNQYISIYAHEMLSRILKSKFDNQFFEKVALLSSYLVERKQFEEAYYNDLASRLLEDFNRDWEEQMISSFKHVRDQTFSFFFRYSDCSQV